MFMQDVYTPPTKTLEQQGRRKPQGRRVPLPGGECGFSSTKERHQPALEGMLSPLDLETADCQDTAAPGW